MTAAELAKMIADALKPEIVFSNVEVLKDEPNIVGFELEYGGEFFVTVYEA